MGKFLPSVVTEKGNALCTSAIASKKIQFTRLVTGCGLYTDAEKDRAVLRNAASLKDQKQEFTFSNHRKISPECVLLTALISNEGLESGYRMTELGVYGKEEEEAEDYLVCISVTESMDLSDFFPPYNGLMPTQIIQDYMITVSDDLQVTVVARGAPALAEDFIDFQEQVSGRFEKLPQVFVGGIETVLLNDNDILLVSDGISTEYDDGTRGEVYYYGVSTRKAVIAEEVAAMTREQWQQQKFSFTATAEMGRYIYFASPSAKGEPEFTVGGFSGGFEKTGSMDIAGTNGSIIQYDVYRSDNAGLGKTTVHVGFGG